MMNYIRTGIAALIAAGVIMMVWKVWMQTEFLFEDLTHEYEFRGLNPGSFIVKISKHPESIHAFGEVEATVNYLGEEHARYPVTESIPIRWNVGSMESYDCLPEEVIHYKYKAYTGWDWWRERESIPYTLNLGYEDFRWESSKQHITDNWNSVWLQLGGYWDVPENALYGDAFKATVVVKVRRQPDGGPYNLRLVYMEADPDWNPWPVNIDDWNIEMPPIPNPMPINCGESFQFDITYVPGYSQSRPIGYVDKATIGVAFEAPDGTVKTYLIHVMAINYRNPG